MQKIFENKIIPILLCGGYGSRLWPMSRESYPKQYLKCNPLSNYSFLQETKNEIKNIKDLQPPIVICNVDHRFIVAEQLREINIVPQTIILEPFGRNTAPAITLASLKAIEKEKDAILLILPADHVIKDINNFVDTIYEGIKYAKESQIITFGVPPQTPETGFGYIEAENSMDFTKKEISKIKRFLEKPSKSKAERLILNKKYLWNSGIFLLEAKTALKEMEKYDSEILHYCKQSLKNSILDLDFIRLNKESFTKCPSRSFDVTIMEKTKKGAVLPLNAGWCDVGSWESLWSISNKDKRGNVASGDIILENTSNCYFKSENKLVVGLGLQNLVVVDTHDAILVANKSLSQDVKNIVSKLINENHQEAKVHREMFRPWGSYLSIAEGLGWQVKKINVSPRASLSLQKHNYRTEHWIIVSGIALVEIGKDKKFLKKNESTYIPLGLKHRLSNPNDEPLIVIEVQSGSYLGEDDIIRYEDQYGRRDFSD